MKNGGLQAKAGDDLMWCGVGRGTRGWVVDIQGCYFILRVGLESASGCLFFAVVMSGFGAIRKVQA